MGTGVRRCGFRADPGDGHCRPALRLAGTSDAHRHPSRGDRIFRDADRRLVSRRTRRAACERYGVDDSRHRAGDRRRDCVEAGTARVEARRVVGRACEIHRRAAVDQRERRSAAGLFFGWIVRRIDFGADAGAQPEGDWAQFVVPLPRQRSGRHRVDRRQARRGHAAGRHLRKQNDHVRIVASLIRAADSSAMWSQTYDRQLQTCSRCRPRSPRPSPVR